MGELTLVVLAAGLGSRFGGAKQVASVDEAGHTLIDYAVYDAVQAGFNKVICVVAPDFRATFDDLIGQRLARHVEVAYAEQRIDALPPGYQVPAGRVKPWGTGQAVLAALPLIDGPFATINADDFYGASAYQQAADFLRTDGDQHVLVAYRLVNTLSGNGPVSRGICQVSSDGRLQDIVEQTAIVAAPGGAVAASGEFLDGQTLVSLNLWGFRSSAAAAFQDGFPVFLDRPDAATAEYFLPDVARALIPQVQVVPTAASWLGLTYADDLPTLRAKLAGYVAAGDYRWQ